MILQPDMRSIKRNIGIIDRAFGEKIFSFYGFSGEDPYSRTELDFLEPAQYRAGYGGSSPVNIRREQNEFIININLLLRAVMSGPGGSRPDVRPVVGFAASGSIPGKESALTSGKGERDAGSGIPAKGAGIFGGMAGKLLRGLILQLGRGPAGKRQEGCGTGQKGAFPAGTPGHPLKSAGMLGERKEGASGRYPGIYDSFAYAGGIYPREERRRGDGRRGNGAKDLRTRSWEFGTAGIREFISLAWRTAGVKGQAAEEITLPGQYGEMLLREDGAAIRSPGSAAGRAERYGIGSVAGRTERYGIGSAAGRTERYGIGSAAGQPERYGIRSAAGWAGRYGAGSAAGQPGGYAERSAVGSGAEMVIRHAEAFQGAATGGRPNKYRGFGGIGTNTGWIRQAAGGPGLERPGGTETPALHSWMFREGKIRELIVRTLGKAAGRGPEVEGIRLVGQYGGMLFRESGAGAAGAERAAGRRPGRYAGGTDGYPVRYEETRTDAVGTDTAMYHADSSGAFEGLASGEAGGYGRHVRAGKIAAAAGSLLSGYRALVKGLADSGRIYGGREAIYRKEDAGGPPAAEAVSPGIRAEAFGTGKIKGLLTGGWRKARIISAGTDEAVIPGQFAEILLKRAGSAGARRAAEDARQGTGVHPGETKGTVWADGPQGRQPAGRTDIPGTGAVIHHAHGSAADSLSTAGSETAGNGRRGGRDKAGRPENNYFRKYAGPDGGRAEAGQAYAREGGRPGAEKGAGRPAGYPDSFGAGKVRELLARAGRTAADGPATDRAPFAGQYGELFLKESGKAANGEAKRAGRGDGAHGGEQPPAGNADRQPDGRLNAYTDAYGTGAEIYHQSNSPETGGAAGDAAAAGRLYGEYKDPYGSFANTGLTYRQQEGPRRRDDGSGAQGGGPGSSGSYSRAFGIKKVNEWMDRVWKKTGGSRGTENFPHPVKPGGPGKSTSDIRGAADGGAYAPAAQAELILRSVSAPEAGEDAASRSVSPVGSTKAEESGTRVRVINESVEAAVIPDKKGVGEGSPDIARLAEQVYRRLEYRLMIERQRRGLFR